MSFVTRLTLQSGDRVKLDAVVDDIKGDAQRKGVEMKGPHATPPDELRVPQYKTAAGDGAFPGWSYTVYRRNVDIVGYEEFARDVAARDFPEGIHVSVEVEQQRPAGN